MTTTDFRSGQGGGDTQACFAAADPNIPGGQHGTDAHSLCAAGGQAAGSHGHVDAQTRRASGPTVRDGQCQVDAQPVGAVADPILPAGQSRTATQMATASGGSDSGDQRTGGTHVCPVAGPTLPAGHRRCDTHGIGASGDQTGGRHLAIGAHVTHAPAPDQPAPTKRGSTSKPMTPGPTAPTSSGDHVVSEAQVEPVAGPTSAVAQRPPTPMAAAPPRTPSSQPTKVDAISRVRTSAGDNQSVPATTLTEPIPPSPRLADPLLALAADVLDDLERVRIANENRLRQLTRSVEDSDGELRGFGLDASHPDVARLAALVDMLGKAEHSAELNLTRMMRRHPLGPWVKGQRGIGDKQAARLLAAIGDPYWNSLHSRPRTVSELWSYCGYHVLPAGHTPIEAHPNFAGGDLTGGNPDQGSLDAPGVLVRVAATRARGQRANWSATAKMRAHLVAVSIVKTAGPWRDVYDTARAKYFEATHQVPCKRCGPAGKPAEVGTPLSAGHQHARALRIVAKAVLRELWRESRRLTTEVPQ